MGSNKVYTVAERAFIREHVALNWGDAAIAEALINVSGFARTKGGVERARQEMRLLRAPSTPSARKPLLTNGDARFQAALRKAVSRGGETAIEGVIVDPTPFSALRFTGEPQLSVCGSSAALAADMGGR